MKQFYVSKILTGFLLLLATLLNAQSNQYLHFDGVNDYTNLPNGSNLISGSNQITMTGWFYNDALGYGQGTIGIRGGGGTGFGQMYLLQLGNGAMECRLYTETGMHQVQAPAGTIQAGVWQHLAWVFNETTVEFFVDGISIGSSSASGTFTATDRPFTIGKTLASGYNFIYKGGIDEVSLWTKALTQAEIQDMMTNELEGNETDLVLYYKFNQGSPEGNNTSITQLLDFSGSTSKNSDLMNFSLTGSTSNFIGELEEGVQTINFEQIPNKLISDVPFQLNATTNSGLPITFEIISGPATVSGNTVTLDGTTGEVVVKASQDGNAEWDPADDVYTTFNVLDPNQVLPTVTVLHPLAGNVHMPSLMPIEVAIYADIKYPDLFSIEHISASIEGTTVEFEDHGNGYFTAWWTPNNFGTIDIDILASNNHGVTGTTTSTLNLAQTASDITVLGTDEVWVYGDVPSETVEADLPSHIGAYTQIIGTLHIDCPSGGCDPWDRVSSIDVQGKDGKWFELIRYLTPYGVACQHEIDLTDFASILKGKTKFRINLGTTGNGFLYTLELKYIAGTAQYPYSKVQALWTDTYQFGDPGNLQPIEDLTRYFPDNTESAKIKLLSTGHGWGDNNTANAAEFSNNTHHIWIDNQETFEQNNWLDCNPNPDGCSPQAGTWYYNRAGWCPGSIAPYFDFDMSSYTTQESVKLGYVLDESYQDNCHPNNPNCESGTTCPNCNDGFNPHLVFNSFLISFGTNPLGPLATTEVSVPTQSTMIYPNPSSGKFYIELENQTANQIMIYDLTGSLVKNIELTKSIKQTQVSLDGYAPGIYIVTILNGEQILDSKRIVIE